MRFLLQRPLKMTMSPAQSDDEPNQISYHVDQPILPFYPIWLICLKSVRLCINKNDSERIILCAITS